MDYKVVGSFRTVPVSTEELALLIESCLKELIRRAPNDGEKRFLEDVLLTGTNGEVQYRVIEPLLTERRISFLFQDYKAAMDAIRKKSLKARGLL